MDLERDFDGVAGALARIGGLLERPGLLETRAPGVSAWSAGQQFRHALAALHEGLSAAGALADGHDARIDRSAAPAERLRALLARGRIPRGLGQAPASTLPGERPTRTEIQAALDEANQRLGALRARAQAVRAAAGTIAHPQLGPLDAALWVRFADIHTRHHLSIVDDIAAAAGAL
jgi:hypothetical protein